MDRERLEIDGVAIVVRPIERDDEAQACARIMSTSEPWMTLRRDYARSIAILRNPTREVYLAAVEGGNEIVGFLILDMRGAFVGYIQSIGIREEWRGKGLGGRLIGFAEGRIFREAPNVFLCVSSFNGRARALYERLGYTVVGELHDYIVQGHSEWLLRKTKSPITDWTTSNAPLAFGSRRAP